MATGLLTPTHVALVLIVALLILGPKRLPQTGRALGDGMREFKDGIRGRRSRGEPEAELAPGPDEATPSAQRQNGSANPG